MGLAAGLLSLLLLKGGRGKQKRSSAPTAEQKWREMLRAMSTVGFRERAMLSVIFGGITEFLYFLLFLAELRNFTTF